MDKVAEVERAPDLDASLQQLIKAAAVFILASRDAHHAQLPEEAQKYGLLMLTGQPGVRLELGLAPTLEAGVMHDGEWCVYFRWAPCAGAPEGASLN